jgi:hypothetical protein
LIVVIGAVLGLGFWQLWDVNRELRKDRDAAQATETDDAEE